MEFSGFQQEEEQSLVNILGDSADKLQLTRRILDLKQVSNKSIIRRTEFPHQF